MKSNFKILFILILTTAVLVSGCASPAPTSAPANTAAPESPAATAEPATEAPAAAAEVNLWTYYGDTGPAAACVKTAADDYNASQNKYVLKIRNLAFTDFNQQVTTAIAAGCKECHVEPVYPDNLSGDPWRLPSLAVH